jgi:hypothetical protein
MDMAVVVVVVTDITSIRQMDSTWYVQWRTSACGHKVQVCRLRTSKRLTPPVQHTVQAATGLRGPFNVMHSSRTFSYFLLLHWSPTTRKLVLPLTSPGQDGQQSRTAQSLTTQCCADSGLRIQQVGAHHARAATRFWRSVLACYVQQWTRSGRADTIDADDTCW